MARGGNRTTEVIREHWDGRAGTFDEEAGHGLVGDDQRRAWLELLSGLVEEGSVRALDVGCGTGFLALALAELGHEVTAIDLSPRMIARAQSKAASEGLPVEFRVGDAVACGCADGEFDLVVARHVIWNLPEPERGVAEWLRVLRPGGRLALIEGKWADNEPLELELARPASRALARAVDVAAAVVRRGGGHPTRLLNLKYRRLEAELPFSGGPSSTRLAAFLTEHGVCEVTVEPLMDATLWGEEPVFPRYLATGTRARS